MTNDRERRLRQHNRGNTRSIAGVKDWRLVYHEEVADTKAGRLRERAIKSRGAQRFLEKVNMAPAPPSAG
jgi:predicted GIY-YIG superfamily endonuclease